MSQKKKLQHKDYTIGWLCALPIEQTAGECMVDEDHEMLGTSETDENTYTFGSIGKHNVVIACLPTMGVTNAAIHANQMRSSFPNLRFGLMVGIGGGIPSETADVRLGDIVVSFPSGRYGGVVQYDLGKTTGSGHFQRTGQLDQPPPAVLTAVAKLKSTHGRKVPELVKHHRRMLIDNENMNTSAYQGAENDQLFEFDYDHVDGQRTCAKCDPERLVKRLARGNDRPVIHYGLIASGNQVMKDGKTREKLRNDPDLDDILCFEMEAAGLMNNFKCLVIRGICDYADSHKNKRWQPYAAAVAAAYAKELLGVIPELQGAETGSASLVNTNPNVSHSRVWSGAIDTGGGPLIQGDPSAGGDMNFSW